MYTPDNIQELKENEIIVFGSNGLWHHLWWLAKLACEKFWAIFGKPEWIQWQSYAINTMDWIWHIKRWIQELFEYATKHNDKQFLFTKIGCGIAWYTEQEIKKLLPNNRPTNILFPKWR